MNYTIKRIVAILGGLAAAGLSVIMLTKGAHVSTWTVDMWATASLVPLVVVAAVVGHGAIGSGRWVAGSLLWALSIAGSGLIVFENLGNRAEVREAKVIAAETRNEDRSSERKRLAEAHYILASCPDGAPASHRGLRCGLRDALVDECRGGDGSRCRGLRRSVGVYEAAISGLTATLTAVSATPEPVDAQAHRVVSLLSWFGVKVDTATARAGVADAHSLGLPLFFDLVAITLLIWGIEGRREVPAGRSVVKPASVPVQTTELVAQVDDNRPPTGGASLTRDEAISQMIRMLERGETWSSQEELRTRLGMAPSGKGTLSNWLQYGERSGQIPRRVQVGRKKAVEAA
jgi:hypothetical protein